ncbi:MAG TPA: helix-turn-helix domain-containing protein [Aestuariivirgaceae bacterium]
MEDQEGYGQFCPVAMAAEVLCSRWTLLIVRELLCGSTRFNDLRRGVPRMSPTLLSKRLKELENAGIIETVSKRGARGVDYLLTQAGRDLEPIVLGLGRWGQCWVGSQLSPANLDPSLLMWDMRRRLNPDPLPRQRCTLKFSFVDAKEGQKDWWLVIDAGKVDLCGFDPGHEIDLYVTAPVRTLTAIWMGLSSVRQEVDGGRLELLGDRVVAGSMQLWLGLSAFAGDKRLAA